VQMINLLIADLDRDMTEARAEEKDVQGDYERMMADSAEKRTADSKSLSEKQAAKADHSCSRRPRGRQGIGFQGIGRYRQVHRFLACRVRLVDQVFRCAQAGSCG